MTKEQIENLVTRYNIEELTESQKKKVDKVNTCVASTPQNKLIFYKSDMWLDSMEEIQDMHNQTDFMYEGKNQPSSIIDAVGY